MSELNFLEKLLDKADVEWMPLGEIGNFIRGNGLQKKDFVESGFPAIHYGQIYTRYGLSADKTFTYVSPELATKLRKAQKNDLLLATTSENDEDVVKPLAWLGDKAAISGDMMLFRHEQNVKYLAHFFQSEIFQTQKLKYITGAKVRRVSSGDLAKIKIPIPCPNNLEKSLAIQSEIVRILDKFTALTAELTAELTVRKKQYAYYRDQLLSFDEGEIQWKMLEEVSDIYDSLHQTPQYAENGLSMIRVTDIKNGYVDLSKTLKVNNEVFTTFTKKYSPQKNDLVMSRVGSYGNVGIIPLDNSACMGQNTVVIHPRINSSYLFYILSSNIGQNFIERNVGGGSQKTLSLKSIKAIPIPLVSEKEQFRIASILGKFDTLTNSISEGLPREIELRQKQYEYYRDLLFAFPKLNVQVEV